MKPMNVHFNLASAANTSNPALYVLRNQGYSLEVTVTKEGRCLYIATKDGRRFVADSAPELLGLVAMWKELGDQWRSKCADMPDILAEVVTEEGEDK